MKTEYYVILFCILAIAMPFQWQESQFKTSDIRLVSFQSSVFQEAESPFIILINDARLNRSYTADVFLGDSLQKSFLLENGVNRLFFTAEEKGKASVRIEVYDNNNEFNGFGSKPNPWVLMFSADVL